METVSVGRNDALKTEVKPGDRVEFRQYGYKQDYCTGHVQKVDPKGVVVCVDHANRKARVAWNDITMVI